MLGRGEQKDCIESKLQGCAALFKDAADHGVGVVTAPLAGKGLLIGKAIPLRLTLTLGASMALTKSQVEKMLKAGFVCGELLEELTYIGLFHAR